MAVDTATYSEKTDEQRAIIGEGFRSLAEGAKVSYDAEAGDKGPKAVNVQTL